MRILEKILSLLLSKEPALEKNLIDAEMCPNCWGKQEYGNEYREIVKERGKDAHNQKAFVEKFIETHLTGIRLKREQDKLICQFCERVYKKSLNNAN